MKKIPKFEKDKLHKITNIEGKIVRLKSGRYITLRQSTYHNKFFILQEFFWENGKRELRLGYYMLGKKPKMRGKWVWGQYAPFIPEKDLKKLLLKAKKKGIIS